MNRSEIIEAYLFLRKYNHSISDETLEFMYQTSLDEFARIQNKGMRQSLKDLHFFEKNGSSNKSLKEILK